jgi:chromate transporter
MQPNSDLSPRHGSSIQLTIFAESGLWPLTAYFLKLGTIGFGGPVALVNDHQFLDEVAVAMITPGPVVITVAFIGFLVAGIAGAVGCLTR